MKILGINTSHDSSVAMVEDGEVKWLRYEERYQRKKYWDPHALRNKNDSSDLPATGSRWGSLVHNRPDDIDHFIFTSFDRRHVQCDFSGLEENLHSKELKHFAEKFAEKQLSRKRMNEIRSQHMWCDWHIEDEPQQDQHVIESICNNSLGCSLMDENVHYNVEDHHIHHAACGYYMSPWNNEEEALCVAWDGGGAQCYYEMWPGYQEHESIFFLEPNKNPTKLWQRLSNYRTFGGQTYSIFNNRVQMDSFMCPETVSFKMKGVDVEFTSRPSSGIKFSTLCGITNLDNLGRAPGKVMGYASYSRGSDEMPLWNEQWLSQKLQQETFEESCKVIEKAIKYKPDCKNIVLSGGYSLNCTNNAKYLERFPDHQIFVDPIAHDAGTAIGAALMLERELKDE